MYTVNFTKGFAHPNPIPKSNRPRTHEDRRYR